jgi:hypothetical protein
MAAERLENKTTASLTLDPLKNEYDTSGVLRYIRASDDVGTDRPMYPNDETGTDDTAGIIILDYNKIYVNDPTQATTLTLQIVALPNEDNLSGVVRAGDENAMKYYILSKSYEKDTDMGNFQKADTFYGKYMRLFALLKNASSANYTSGVVQRTESVYY